MWYMRVVEKTDCSVGVYILSHVCSRIWKIFLSGLSRASMDQMKKNKELFYGKS
jgi:hypothetical protein